MVSAFASANSAVPGQVKTSEKFNVITAISKLLYLLNIRGLLITLDAIVCQTKIVENFLPVKSNQERLQNALNNLFSISCLGAKETYTIS
jgi:predicted transposase YbfD/YdcC